METQSIARDALRRQWELCFKQTSRGISLVEPRSGLIVSVNPALAAMHGGAVEDFVGRPLTSLFSEDSVSRIPALADLAEERGYARYESDHRRLDGSTFPVRTEVMAARDDEGELLYRIAWYDDLTEERQMRREADRAQRDFEAAFHFSPHGVAIVGLDGRFLHVNRKLAEIVGYPVDELKQLTFQEITHPEDLDRDLDQLEALVAGDLDSYEMEKRYYTRPGHLIWVQLAVAIVRDDDGSPRHFISQVQDISARKRLEQHNWELANRDPVSSLYNRRHFEQALDELIRDCRDGDERGALVLLDLDGFKEVNDTLGHAAGDRVIRAVGRALSARARADDLVARIGGDEFAALVRDVDPAAAAGFAEALREAVAAIDEGSSCRASVGVCHLGPTPPDPDSCLRIADRAMYLSKARGGDRVELRSA
jgi:diguanylate cyclase (GGDEF)-like protein/PAS domain S-box-containing protein